MNKREKRKFDKQMAEEFKKIAEEMVKCSGGRLRLAYQEKNDSKNSDIGIEHFLKLDGKRLGKDIEMYIFLGHRDNWHRALNQFINDIMPQIAGVLPELPTKISLKINELREKIYLKDCQP